MKRFAVFGLLLLFLCGAGFAESDAEQKLHSTDLSGMIQFAEEYAPDFSVSEISESALKGDFSPLRRLSDSLENQLQTAAAEALCACGKLIAPLLLLGVLTNCAAEGHAGAAEYICLLGIASGILESGSRAISAAKECISLANAFTKMTAPIFATFLTAIGRADGAALITPAAALIGDLSVRIFQKVGLPLCEFALCACAAGGFGRTFRLERATDFFSKLAAWGTGLCVTVFTAMTAIRSDVSSSLDGITVRAAKYAMDGAAPIIGNGISEAWDTYIAGIMIAKSAVGVTGVLLLAAACAMPMLRILSVLLAFSMTSSLADVLGLRDAAQILRKAGVVCKMSLMMCTGSIAVSTILLAAAMKAGTG